MRQVNVHAAKTHLSRLIEEVEAGETVILARAGKPVARIVPIDVEPRGRIGFLKGHVKGADAPMTPPIFPARRQPTDCWGLFLKILLDTPVLLWVAADSVQLDDRARRLILDEGNDLYFSSASIWEINLRGASSFDGPAVDLRLLRRGLLDAGYGEVPVRSEHAMAVGEFADLRSIPSHGCFWRRPAMKG